MFLIIIKLFLAFLGRTKFSTRFLDCLNAIDQLPKSRREYTKQDNLSVDELLSISFTKEELSRSQLKHRHLPSSIELAALTETNQISHMNFQ